MTNTIPSYSKINKSQDGSSEVIIWIWDLLTMKQEHKLLQS